MILGFWMSALFAGAAAALALPGEEAAYEATLNSAALSAAERYSGSHCADAQVVDRKTEHVTIGDQPDLAAAREKITVSGCGKSSVQNIAVVRTGGTQPWRMVAGVPGGTIASMATQRQMLSVGQAAVADGVAASCEARSLADVYVAARPGNVQVRRSGEPLSSGPGRFSLSVDALPQPSLDSADLDKAWVEVWPFTVCGHDRSVALVVLPGKAGLPSRILSIPLWKEVERHGRGALPAPAP